MSAWRCAVVIPSHNRCQRLEQVLGALAGQTLPPEDFEVVVVLDGSTDGSATMLQRWQHGRRLPGLQWIEQSQQGQAAARTAGARQARAPVLVFIDDDVVPQPGLLAAHLRWHRDGARVAVLGSAPVVRPPRPTPYDVVVWSWWEDAYHRRAQPGAVLGYRDFCAGNVSLRREDFFHVGGFDPAFRGYGGEDYDLGFRLLQAGVRFIPDPAARAEHYHLGTPAQVLRNMRHEGRHDVLLGRKHPALRRSLRLMSRTEGARLLFTLPTFCRAGCAWLLRWLGVCERLGLRRSWRRLFGTLRHYAYWRGVQESLGNWGAYRRFQQEAPPPPEFELDITHGLPALLPSDIANGPSRLLVRAHGRALGWLQLEEPLDQVTVERLADELIRQWRCGLSVVMAQHALPDGARAA